MTTLEQDHALERLSLENAGTPLQVKEDLEDGAITVTLTVVIDRWGQRCAPTKKEQ